MEIRLSQVPRLTDTGFDATVADVNKDGSIIIVDALLIAQYYVGLITGF